MNAGLVISASTFASREWNTAMDLHHIRYFLAVATTLNFTKAAACCNVSQPALSRAIQQLEEEVGGLLFRRERKFTRLTDLGNLMKPHFEKIIAEVNDVRTETKHFLTLGKACLNIGVLCTIAPARFTRLLAHFGGMFPGTSIKVFEGTLGSLTALLEAGEVDIALLASPEHLPDEFEAKVIYTESFVIAFPTGHRFAKMREVPMRELGSENYLQRLNCEFDAKFDELLEQQRVNMTTVYASEHESWIQTMIAAGLGVCLIPEFSAVSPGVQFRPCSDPKVSRNICLVTVARRQHSSAVQAFLRSLSSLSFPDSNSLHFPFESSIAAQVRKRRKTRLETSAAD